jgi:hypothetical protein
MTTILQRIRQTARLLVRVPSIGAAALAYCGVIHLSSLQADLLDISDPWWVVTVGLVLLVSPVYHAFVIGKTASLVAGEAYSIRSVPMESFGDLVVGELLVNACVILGSALFLLPGIYVGLRSIYYKQLIVLHKSRSVAAIQQSFRMTVAPRVILQMFLLLSIAYCIPLAVDFLLMPVTQALWAHFVAIVLSTLFVAWVNVYITLTFGEIAGHEEIVEMN